MKELITKPLWLYLDLNKWIDLGRAYHDRQNPQKPISRAIVDQLIQRARKDELRCCLSTGNIIEVLKASNKDRRARLTEFITELSGGWMIFSAGELQELEASCVIGAILQRLPEPGVIEPFARFSDLFRIQVDSVDLPDDVRFATDLRLNDPNVLRKVLVELPENQRSGQTAMFNEKAERVMKLLEAFRALEMDNGFDLKRFQEAYFCAVLRGLRHCLEPVLIENGTSWDGFLNLPFERMVELLRIAPTIDIEYQLLVEGCRQSHHKFVANDLNDITTLASAIGYCDIVVFEKRWASLARAAGLPEQYGCRLFNDVADLEAVMDELLPR